MSDGFDILVKMNPMARRAIACLEAVEKATLLNNRDDIEKNLEVARNAISMMFDDLGLHDNLVKAGNQSPTDSQTGIIMKYDNAIALGVVRAGRTTNVFRPHEVY
jgi:hypothetical protein